MKAALDKIPGEIAKLIGNHIADLEEAWANCAGEETLSISFPVKIGFEKRSGKPICEIGISFVKEKIQDIISFNWDDRQLSLLKTGEK